METSVSNGKTFDVSAQFRVRVISGTEKLVTVRWPSDGEWCDYSRAQRTIRTALGRGKSEQRSVGEETAAAELLGKIRVEGGEDFDGAEALDVVDRLEWGKVMESEREGEALRITLRVWGVNTVHVLRMPTARERREYENASTKRQSGMRNTTEIRAFLEPSAALYRALSREVTGYAGAVPIVHQAAAIGEVLREVALALEEDVDGPE